MAHVVVALALIAALALANSPNPALAIHRLRDVSGANSDTTFAGDAPRDSLSARSATTFDSEESPDSSSAACDSTFDSEEPPDQAPPDQDFEDDLGDSLEAGRFELGYGLSGRSHAPPRSRRRLRVRAEGLEASVREGPGDALAGGAIEAHALGGVVALGRRSPGWGRGLLVGAPREPWRGLEGPAFGSRSAAGNGIAYARAGAIGLDLIAQHAAHDSYAGAAFGAERCGALFVLSRPDTGSRAVRAFAAIRGSSGKRAGPASGEIAMDARGRWRAEGSWRPAASGLGLGIRLGHAAFEGASRAATARPGVALALATERRERAFTLRSTASMWRFGSGASGSRVSLEVVAALPQHGRLATGLEERHGTRRNVDHAAPGSFRQGAWIDWSGGSPGLRLDVRHELWTRRTGLQDPVRHVASIGLSSRPVPGAELGVSLTLYHTRGGEAQFVSEIESDRRVLRALSGTGRRLRLQLKVPAAAGSIRAAVTLPEAAGHRRSPQWTLDWTRSVRAR